MITRIRALLILSTMVFGLAACKPPATATPEPTAAPAPTSALVEPMATATTAITQTAPLAGSTPVIVARQEGSPAAILTLVKLQPGRKYRLAVTSSAGAAAFSGTWSESAVGTDGLPGVKTGVLEGTTPANFDIVPPMTSVAKDWVYGVSVSNKSLGHIAIAVVEVTP
jgi:hypothetical protein